MEPARSCLALSARALRLDKPQCFLHTDHTDRVSSSQPDGRSTWDDRAPEKRDSCGVFSSLGALIGDLSEGALVGQLCRMGHTKHVETDPTAPDLVVAVKTTS